MIQHLETAHACLCIQRQYMHIFNVYSDLVLVFAEKNTSLMANVSFLCLPSCSWSAKPVSLFLPPAALHCTGARTQRQFPGSPFRRHPPAAWRDGEEILPR